MLHVYTDEIAGLREEKLQKFVKLFFREVFAEKSEGVAKNVMGIVHNAAGYLPELVKYFGVNHPNLTVKVSSLYKKSDLETLKMEEFMQRVESSYDCGTYRSGPLLQFSLVGTVQEESGGYFPEFLDLLEQCLFLKETMPWGTFSALNLTERNKSNDGPIMWVRPGEQVVPTAESRSPYKKRRYVMHIVIWFCCNVVMDEAWKNVWYLTTRVSLLALKLCLLSMILFALHQVMITILQYFAQIIWNFYSRFSNCV